MIEIVKKYALDVTTGAIVAGKFTIKACERFLKDLSNPNIELNQEEAERPIKFIQEYCRHWEGALRGQPIVLHPFQMFVLANLYGWYYKGTNKRRFRTFYLQIARKNAKTTLAALMALYDLLIDEDPTPQILIGANNEEQAKLTVHCAGMISEISPAIRSEAEAGKLRIYKKYDSVFKITYRGEGRDGMIFAMSRTANTKDGTNPSKFIIDEYHEAQTDHLKNVSESGQAARENPSGGVITTAGFNRFGPCYQSERKISAEILEGKKEDESHFCMIFEPDDERQWLDEVEWLKANPLMFHEKMNNTQGANKTIVAFLRDRVKKAQNEGGNKEVDFKTKNLNIWTTASKTWISDEQWMLGAEVVNEDELEGQECFGGLDLAAIDDTASFMLTFPKEDGSVKVITRVYCNEKKVQERTQNGFNYSRWEQHGHLIVTPGNVIDHEFIIADILELASRFNIQGIAYDPYSSLNVVLRLQDAGIKMLTFSQAIMNMSPPTKELKKLAISGKLHHGGHPVLRWQMGNIEIYTDANENIKITKKTSQDKVDAPVALVMSIGCMMQNHNFTEEITEYDFVGG